MGRVPGGSGSLMQTAPSVFGSSTAPSGESTWTSYPGLGFVAEPGLASKVSMPVGFATIGQPVSVCHQLSTTGTPSFSCAHV